MPKFILLSIFALALAAPFSAQASKGSIPYSPQAMEAAKAKGCAVFLEFGASW